MSNKAAFRVLVAGVASICAVALGAQAPARQELDQQYQSAVANYEAGRYAEAASQLEKLLPFATTSPTVHELLGLVYASLNKPEKALNELKTAVQLKPDWPEARTNLGTALLHSGNAAIAGEQFSKALELDPKSFDTNRNLGEYYVHSGKVGEGRTLLERAHQIDPNSYDNTYDLVMADFLLNRLAEARTLALELAAQKDSGELRNLLGQIDEKDGKYVAAANDFEAAAHLDPSEDNLFDWGCEMLLHRTYEPAITIFDEGVKRYPKSARLLIGLGLSLYSRGKYDEAIKALLASADLNPSDPRCYVFLSKAYNSSPLQADEVIQAFKRYADLQPTSAQAQYYYAISLWKGKRTADTTLDQKTVESLLMKSISLDDSLAEAHVQLGNLYADQHEYQKSIPQYVRALALDPTLADAHYRLGTDYVHIGQKEDAQKEFAVYQKLRADHLDEVEKERDQVQQFVYDAKSDASLQQDHAN